MRKKSNKNLNLNQNLLNLYMELVKMKLNLQ